MSESTQRHKERINTTELSSDPYLHAEAHVSSPTCMNIDTQSLVMNKNAGPAPTTTVPMKALPRAVVEGRGPTARGTAVWKGPLDAKGDK